MNKEHIVKLSGSLISGLVASFWGIYGYQMPSIPVLVKMMKSMGIDEIRFYTKG